ncbi:diguanylate cyclase [Paenibacillus sp. FJAT-26967]|uniref:diguanylate cyclase domain-containing protein n=1 Tax=Paenibacillus sp. FJAT-26967 TaxID=1729690 RepID=UPI000AE8D761|nr:diguanylate cyclase [Paenibacillus sp. FJAT-26967]
MLNLRTAFALVLAVIIFLLTFLLSIVISQRTTTQVEENIGASLSQVAYQMADKLDYFMWSHAGEVDMLSQMLTYANADNPDELRTLIEQLKKSFPSFTWVAFIDPSGKVKASSDGILTGSDISARPVFTEGRKGRFIGDVHEAVLLSKLLPNPSGEPLQFVDISTPVFNKKGEWIGVLAAHLSWEWAREVEKSILKPLQDRMNQLDVFIVSKKDNTVLLGPRKYVFRPMDTGSIQQAQKESNGWTTEQWPEDNGSYLTGYAYGAGYMNYPGLGWSVLVRQPADIAFSSVNELNRFIVVTGIIMAIVFAVLGALVAGWIAKPLRRIAQAADQLRSGYHVKIPIFHAIKDLNILSSSLNNLVDNLTRTESALDHMADLAHHDKLTGLPNRIALDTYMEIAMKQARENNTTLTFLYLDLDGFKLVNDTWGHPFGDKLLRHVAERLGAYMQAQDVVFRIGGDEFVILLKTQTSTPSEETLNMANDLIRLLNEPFLIEDEVIRIGCSIGGAIWPSNAGDPIETIRLADKALYVSKQKGKNCVTFY